jgi:hypothetical protein
MLYDPRWERPFGGPPSRRTDVFDLLLAALVPVFIGASTLAAVTDELLLLVLPVAANVAGLVLLRGGARKRPPVARR